MAKSIFVVTYPEDGPEWDCVGGVYRADSEEDVYKFIAKERGVDSDDAKLRYDVIVHESSSIIEL